MIEQFPEAFFPGLFKYQKKMKKELLIENISYSKAANYLDQMKDPLLRTFFSIYTGGTFDLKPIKKWMNDGDGGEPFSGLMFWNCLLDFQIGKKFLVVLEPKFGFDYSSELKLNPDIKKWRPSSSNLFCPGQEFKEDFYSLSLSEKLDRLKNHKIKKEKDDQMPNFNVKEAIDLFMTEPLLSKINQTPFSFFSADEIIQSPNSRKEKYLDLFVRQKNFKYVRFYFGYDNSTQPFHLRMILVPTWGSGRNVVTPISEKGKKLKDGTLLLQKSWPPPPDSI